MPVKGNSKGKGKGKRKGGGRKGKGGTQFATRKPDEMSKKSTDLEVYGQVIRAEGNRRFMVSCQKPKDPSADYMNINCNLKGSYRRRVTIGDCVLVQIWEFDQSHGTIIDGYSAAEVVRLKTHALWDFRERQITAANDGSAESEAVTATEEQLLEFIGKEDQKEREIQEANAIDAHGPAMISKITEIKSESSDHVGDDFDIDAI